MNVFSDPFFKYVDSVSEGNGRLTKRSPQEPVTTGAAVGTVGAGAAAAPAAGAGTVACTAGCSAAILLKSLKLFTCICTVALVSEHLL